MTSTTAEFTFTSSELGGTFAYILDGATPVTTSDGTAAFTGLALGTHTFTVTAKDGAGNSDGSPATRMWKRSMATRW